MPHEHRHPALCCADLVFLKDDQKLQRGEESRGDDAAQRRRDHPTCRNGRHRRPVDDADARRGYTGAQDAADDRMGRRHRRPDPRCDIDPRRRREQGGHHRPHKGVGTRDQAWIDDAFRDRFDDVATGDQGARRFENDCDDEGADDRQRFRADGRSDVIGDIVGANIERHVSADHAGRDDQP